MKGGGGGGLLSGGNWYGGILSCYTMICYKDA